MKSGMDQRDKKGPKRRKLSKATNVLASSSKHFMNIKNDSRSQTI